MIYVRLGFYDKHHRVICVRGTWTGDKAHDRIKRAAKALEPGRELFAYKQITQQEYLTAKVKQEA